MKRKICLIIFAALVSVFLLSSVSLAVEIYVDAAPNVYGSPDYDSWQDTAYAAVAAGTFTNMANGVNPDNIGTTDFEIQDEVVYSFGDLGKRLSWIYWVPGETVENLEAGDRFQISLVNVWDGESWDFYDYYYGSTWLTPSHWQNYDSNGDGNNDGVIGVAGMAWWGAYGYSSDTPEARAALADDMKEWGSVSESWIFTAKLDGEEVSITSHRDAVVPEPTTIMLLSLGLLGFLGIKAGRKKS
ncbi:MAG: PEP-CTERM sorting domain-containing protein [Deltaproteobacteria bacterium]|nr:PEP-CTERM sorting domain-containing protein [Deltaproteobacteria bacterium]